MLGALVGVIASRPKGTSLSGALAAVPILLSDSPSSFRGKTIASIDVVGLAAVPNGFVGQNVASLDTIGVATVPSAVVGQAEFSVPVGLGSTT